jgi:hypothetical protein
VKAYVRRQKNDAADAEAICEAVTRPTMRFVPVKSAERQGVLVLHRTRDLLVRQRTMLINAIRGHCAEFGMIAPQGAYRASDLIEQVREAEVRIPTASAGHSKVSSTGAAAPDCEGAIALMRIEKRTAEEDNPWCCRSMKLESLRGTSQRTPSGPAARYTPRKQAGQMTAPDRSSTRFNFPLAAQGPSTDDSTQVASVLIRLPPEMGGLSFCHIACSGDSARA